MHQALTSTPKPQGFEPEQELTLSLISEMRLLAAVLYVFDASPTAHVQVWGEMSLKILKSSVSFAADLDAIRMLSCRSSSLLPSSSER